MMTLLSILLSVAAGVILGIVLLYIAAGDWLNGG